MSLNNNNTSLLSPSEVISSKIGKFIGMLFKTVLAIINNSMFMFAFILELAVIHFEALAQASIIPREGQYWISFGLAGMAAIFGMVGFMGLFEWIHAKRTEHDVNNLYSQLGTADVNFSLLVDDAISDHKTKQFIIACAMIPLSLMLQAVLTILSWKGIPYAIDYFQMEYVQDLATNEFIKTTHRDAIELTLKGISIAIGLGGFILAGLVGALSPVDKTAKDFIVEGWEKYWVALSLQGVDVPSLQEFLKNPEKYALKAPIKPAAAGSSSGSSTPPAGPPPSSTPPPASAPPVPVANMPDATQIKSFIDAEPILVAAGFNFAKIKESVLIKSGIDPTTMKIDKDIAGMSPDVKRWFTSNKADGTAPDSKFESLTRKILGTNKLETPALENTGAKGISYLKTKLAEYNALVATHTTGKAQAENDFKTKENDLQIAKAGNNAALIAAQETALATAKKNLDDVEKVLHQDKDNLTNTTATLEAVIDDLKTTLMSANISYS